MTPEHGVEFFETDTEDEAKTTAHEAMASWRRDADSDAGWIEDIGALEWGEAICHERAVCTTSRPDPNSEYDTSQLVHISTTLTGQFVWHFFEDITPC